jgi:exopolysaccharide biosynthesis predicted pyruvyltransferase EpsI
MKAKQNQKQVSIEEYIETYCQEQRVRERFAVYVSEKTHHNLRRIAGLFASEHHTTTSSLADSILSCHFEAHRELLNDAQRKSEQEFLEWFKNQKWHRNEKSVQPEESPEDQSDDIETDERASIINDEPVE